MSERLTPEERIVLGMAQVMVLGITTILPMGTAITHMVMPTGILMNLVFLSE
jgi:hypothetical protein